MKKVTKDSKRLVSGDEIFFLASRCIGGIGLVALLFYGVITDSFPFSFRDLISGDNKSNEGCIGKNCPKDYYSEGDIQIKKNSSLYFEVKLYSAHDWDVQGNCFEPLSHLFGFYSPMTYLTADCSMKSFDGPLNLRAWSKGYCYFYISILDKDRYLPNYDGDTVYPPADFQISGMPQKEIGQEQGMLENISVWKGSQLLPITVVEIVGDEGPNPNRYQAGSLVFKVEIPKEGK